DISGTERFFYDNQEPGNQIYNGFILKNGRLLVPSDNFPGEEPEIGRDEIPSDLSRFSSATFWVRLTTLPRGYGYALDAMPYADRAGRPAALKAAQEGASRPQIDMQRLRGILNSPHTE